MTSCSKRQSTTGWARQLLALSTAAALLAGCASSPDKPKAGAEALPGTEAEAPDLGDPQARFEAAVTLLQRSDLNGAAAAFRKLEADFPEYAGPATNLGLIHLRKQEYEQAVGAFSRAQERGAGNEIQLTDAMLKLEKQQKFYGYHYQGRTFDCGSPEGFVEANVAFALWRPDMHDSIAEVIGKLLGDLEPIERREHAR